MFKISISFLVIYADINANSDTCHKQIKLYDVCVWCIINCESIYILSADEDEADEDFVGESEEGRAASQKASLSEEGEGEDCWFWNSPFVGQGDHSDWWSRCSAERAYQP